MTTDWTEATDADIPRVDLVGKAANGSAGFLLMKQDGAGLVDADMVRDLIAKAEPEPEPPAPVSNTSALMKMIHEAALKDEKPLGVTNNIRVTTTGASAEQIARAVGWALRKSESTYAQEGMMTAPVAKADPVDAEPADIDLTQPLADSSDVLAESMPGSAAWEQLDADSAMKWTAVLARAKNALEVLGSRELMESDSVLGDDDDRENAWDLEDACCAIDFAIGTLAAYAVGEQAEAEQMDDIASMTKAAASINTDQLAVLEGFTSVVKAGRVLSSANEAAIRGAVESLQNVLSSLPAPIPDQTVTKSKEAVVAETQIVRPELQSPEEKAALQKAKIAEALGVEVTPTVAVVNGTEIAAPDTAIVVKAKGDPLTPVYDQNGDLVGMVDATNLIPIAPAAAAAKTDDAAEAPADAAAPDATVAPPAAPDAATIPGTDTVQAPVDTTVTKTATDEAAVLKDALEKLVEQSTANAELASVVKGMQEQIDFLKAMPDDRKSPRLNGATGTPGMVSRDADDNPFAVLQKAVEDATDPIAKRAAQNALFYAQVKQRVSAHS